MKKVVLVTGGSRGMGAAISERFAKEGYDVIIIYKENEERAESLKRKLEDKYKSKITLYKVDLSIETDINDMVEKIYETYENVDVLVNNAGMVIDKDFNDRTVNDWMETLKVNLIAPLYYQN